MKLWHFSPSLNLGNIYIMQKYHIYFVLLMFISLQSLLSYLVGILDIFRVVVFLQIDFVYSSL